MKGEVIATVVAVLIVSHLLVGWGFYMKGQLDMLRRQEKRRKKFSAEESEE